MKTPQFTVCLVNRGGFSGTTTGAHAPPKPAKSPTNCVLFRNWFCLSTTLGFVRRRQIPYLGWCASSKVKFLDAPLCLLVWWRPYIDHFSILTDFIFVLSYCCVVSMVESDTCVRLSIYDLSDPVQAVQRAIPTCMNNQPLNNTESFTSIITMTAVGCCFIQCQLQIIFERASQPM